jgi:flagellar basal-body rod protein FlgF
VQMQDGTEAYTRNGSLQISPNGILQTANGQTVMGEGGPIAIPPNTTVSVGKDGSISSLTTDTVPATSTIVGRLKLVNPDQKQLVRGDDGFFRMQDGSSVQADPAVTVTSGALEGSNVSAVDSMVNMISLARSLETQMSLLKNAENNAAKATQILALT